MTEIVKIPWTVFVKEIRPVQFGKTTMYEASASVYSPPFETQPTEGEHDYRTCEKCQKAIQDIREQVSSRFEKFPFCCEQHKPLAKLDVFKKEDFGDAATQIAHKVVFTYQHIKNNIDANTPDWLQPITDYIDHTVDSFGKMPEGHGEPFWFSNYIENVIELVSRIKPKDKQRKKETVEYLRRFITPSADNLSGSDEFAKTYNDWLSAFPFEITHFRTLRNTFENWLPMSLMLGEMQVNSYNGMTRWGQITRMQFAGKLSELTSELLKNTNTKALIDSGVILDLEEHEWNLIGESHKLKQHTLIASYAGEEQTYHGLLSDWLENERVYIERIKPLFQQISNKLLPQQNTGSKATMLSDNTKIELRNQLGAIPKFEDKINALETFCKTNEVRNLSELFFQEWFVTPYGTSEFSKPLVPMASTTKEEREFFREWAVGYYKRSYKDATVEGRIQWCIEKMERSPSPARLIEAELEKANQETDALHDGWFRLGRKKALEGDSLDFSDFNAYSFEILPMLKGYANFHYVLFLEEKMKELKNTPQNSVPANTETPAMQEPEIVKYDSFAELFRDPAKMKECVDVLKKVRVGKNRNRREGIISQDGIWIDKNPNKSVLVAWVSTLRSRGKIIKVDDVTLVPLLEKQFPGLSLSKDASNFRKYTEASSKYEADFLSLIK